MDDNILVAALEAVLFAAGEPTDKRVLCLAIGVTIDALENAIDYLEDHYASSESRGLSLIRLQDSVQLATKQELFEFVERALRTDAPSSLSQAALETLAIVAYRQPATRSDIERIRGVQSTSSLDLLIARGLVYESERLDVPGRPKTFRTTLEFLKLASLDKLEDLPNFDEFQKVISNQYESEPNQDS
ncbi:MAG: SMC-Scp complex subunit ScpB [Eubacteriaceae bacterium]|nr:SMC-Scp complex subunit ScpB [Eubacteriaceae bacterium]